MWNLMVKGTNNQYHIPMQYSNNSIMHCPELVLYIYLGSTYFPYQLSEA